MTVHPGGTRWAVRHRFGALTLDAAGPLPGYEERAAPGAAPGRVHLDLETTGEPAGGNEVVLGGGHHRHLEVRRAPGDRWVVRTTASVPFTLDPGRRRITAHIGERPLGFDDTDVLIGTVLPRALAAAGGTALHAATAVTPFGAVAVCGASGTGKSTAAAGLAHRRRLPVLGDDAALVDTAGEPVELWVCDTDLRLSEATRRLLDWPAGRPLARPKDRHVGTGGAAATWAHPLVAVVRLVPGTKVTRARLGPADAVIALRDNLLRIERADPAGRARELPPLARIAGRVPVYAVGSPRTPGTLDELLAVIEGCATRP